MYYISIIQKGLSLKCFQNDGDDNIKEFLISKILPYYNHIFEYCIKSKEPKILHAKTQTLLQIFNALAISVLKAEYIIFDDYSEKLDKLSGFCLKEYGIKEKLINEEKNKHLDVFLIESLLSSIWYLIELCKKNTFHDDTNKNQNSEFVILNCARQNRADTILPVLENSEIFLPLKLIKTFEVAFESLIDVTTIDHHFDYTLENFEKLLIALERIESLKEKVWRLTTESRGKFNVDNETNKDFGKDGAYFDNIVSIIRFKAFILLNQYIKHYDRKKKFKFIERYCLIVYGFQKDPDTNLEQFIENSLIQSHLNYYAKKKQDLHDKNEKEKIVEINYFKKENNDFEFLSKFGTTYRDIQNFNKASKKSIEIYCDFSSPLSLCRKSKKTKSYLFSDDTNSIEKTFSSIYKVKNKIIENPTIISHFIDYLHSVLEGNLQTISNNYNEEQYELLDKCFNLFLELKIQLGKYLQRENDFGLIRFQAPLQYCYYEFSKIEINNFPLTEDFISKYDISNNETVFFFNSLGLSPIDIKGFKEKSKEYEFSVIDFKHRLIKIQSDEIKRKLVKITDIEEKTDDKIKDANRTNITILGILGAFLTFASLSVGAIRAIDNIIKFLLFTVAFVFAVLVFVFAIRFKVSEILKKRDKNKSKTKGSFSIGEYEIEFAYLFPYLFYLIILGVLIGIEILLFCNFKEEIFDKKGTKFKSNTEIQIE